MTIDDEERQATQELIAELRTRLAAAIKRAESAEARVKELQAQRVSPVSGWHYDRGGNLIPDTYEQERAEEERRAQAVDRVMDDLWHL